MKKFPKKFSVIFTIAIIGFLGFSITASAADSAIPEWIKNNAKWWAEGSISEADYITSLEYLITNEILQIPIPIPIPITEVTAAQSALTEEERAQSFKVTISNIIAPISVLYFEKFELQASSPLIEAYDPISRMYVFDDPNPRFYLESLPSADKKNYYELVSDWMDGGSSLNVFDLDIEVLDGTGSTIQTWEFTRCGITSYGTYLQDTIFIYSFSEIQDSEIRDRGYFSCSGIHLSVP